MRRGFEAIVLAAGSGSRFGGGKLVSDFEGAPLIEGALAAAFAAPARCVTVVLGADDRVEEAALAFARRWGESRRLNLVYAADHAHGLSASLRAGLAAIRDCRGVFIFLGDMPRIPHGLLDALADAVEQGAAAAAPICGGRRGHPALLSQDLFDALRALSGDQGARSILDDLGDRLALIPTEDEGVLFDVDLPSSI
ncbi:nucleotidyltransferase family protein [Caulobacter segnis]|uniref:nucleotidyltransferase family protein n=1 Tax=Caulobacter segnis TaxID=88688 RepID=UPI00240F63DE|nr:nucleotidyltransferase family protein [Caulobacter segnis]MDG2521597.1 nucleotidyltransferase family protein [Caulobacter segnis]